MASLPYLSLEPSFRRGHGMIYQALSEGGIDEEALRDLLVAARPRDWPLVFAIDASTYARPEAECSPDREFHHHSCAGFHSGDGAAIAGWASQLSFAHDSWTAPKDQVRVGARDDATRQAACQVIAHSARLRAAGETRIPLYVRRSHRSGIRVHSPVRCLVGSLIHEYAQVALGDRISGTHTFTRRLTGHAEVGSSRVR